MRQPRPWVFFFLILPFGASFGFVSVALPYIARQRGISVASISAVIAAAFIPHTPKFLWAPVVDVTWSRKGWYLLSLALVSLGTFASMAMPITASSVGTLATIVVASQVGLTVMGMSCEAMIGHRIAPEAKARAAGWFQAGTFLGLGIGGGAAIELVARLGGPVAGALIAVSFGACSLPLLWFDDPREANRSHLAQALRALARTVLGLARSRRGIAALFLCVSPIGAGAASNLFSAIAQEWHAGPELVALTTGALGGIVSAAGAAGGGRLAGRLGPGFVYALAGGATAAMAVAMALAPHVAHAYAFLTLAYQACNGAAFAAFGALAFDVAGSEAVATKYNVLASLANTAITYTTRIDGAAHARWGGTGVLLVDAALTFGGIVALAIGAAVLGRASPGEGSQA